MLFLTSLRMLTWTAAVLLLAGAAGCKTTQRPQLFHPGPTDYQRFKAMEHDPYPDAYNGPEALGTRPREYSTPHNDSNRYPMRRGQPAPVAPAAW